MGIASVLLGIIMEVLHIINKGELMNTSEKFHIYNITCLHNQINDKWTAKLTLFNVIILYSTDRGHQ
jgi:hypothetical protein